MNDDTGLNQNELDDVFNPEKTDSPEEIQKKLKEKIANKSKSNPNQSLDDKLDSILGEDLA